MKSGDAVHTIKAPLKPIDTVRLGHALGVMVVHMGGLYLRDCMLI